MAAELRKGELMWRKRVIRGCKHSSQKRPHRNVVLSDDLSRDRRAEAARDIPANEAKKEMAAELRADLQELEDKHGQFSDSAKLIRETRDARG